MVGWLEFGLEQSRREFGVTRPDVIVSLVSCLVTLICVLCHYEFMSVSSRWIRRVGMRRQMRVVLIILTLLVAHVVEVWIFGVTYWFLDAWPSLGHIEGSFEEGALDFVYFSVVNYTTLGFGDMVPHGPIRILSGSEALVGLVMITWSASLAFLEMQRDWPHLRRPMGG